MYQTFSTVPRPAPQTAPLNILVTGAARGIGFELVRQYAEADPKNAVVAGVRDLKACEPLRRFTEQHANVHIVGLDTGSEQSINASVAQLPASFTHVDLLFNNAGLFGVPTPLGQLKASAVNSLLQVNVTGPLLVVQAYQALLLKAREPKVCNVSSELGATHLVTPVAQWGVLPYGASKAALNFLNLALQAAVPEITFLSVSPGWVATDMGSSFGTQAPVSTEDSVLAMRALMQQKGKADGGSFWDVVTGTKLLH